MLGQVSSSLEFLFVCFEPDRGFLSIELSDAPDRGLR